jgi:hypothetical protein
MIEVKPIGLLPAPVAAGLPVSQGEWVGFPGGELEGKRPKALCPSCREKATEQADDNTRPICFLCYRAHIDRERALQAAAQLNTASAERFQSQLPFEPVNRPRLAMLKAERVAAYAARAQRPDGRFIDRRHEAQIAARRALQRIAAGLRPDRGVPAAGDDRARAVAAAIHAAELQLPESWLPFVVSG